MTLGDGFLPLAPSPVVMSSEFFVVVALGDSLTRGYRRRDPDALDPRVPYPAQLEMLLKARLRSRTAFVVNAGINGDSTDGMITRFARDVAGEVPDVVVVLGGINDLGYGRSPEQVMANLSRLYEMSIGIKAKPVACTLTPTHRTSTAMKRLNELISEHAAEKRILFADLYAALADAEGNLLKVYSDDGAHLTMEGYRRVAETLFVTMTPLLPRAKPDQ